jgi:hypothetical protein
MYAQLTYFDGPRSRELVEAGDRASQERIKPLMLADQEMRDHLVANYVLRQPDGGEVVITIVDTEESLRRGQELVMGSELLPGEDPMLLPGPDRVEVYRVVDASTGDRNGVPTAAGPAHVR